jgi:hypothetical protein
VARAFKIPMGVAVSGRDCGIAQTGGGMTLLDNMPFDRTAGSHSLAAAGQHARSGLSPDPNERRR